MKIFTRSIIILSFVSLLTDVSSEMLYPILPLYLKSIGYSVLFIGILEGFAEAVAGLSKGYFGSLSDKTGKRSPFIQSGYLLSALSKPMLAILTNPVWIFLSRTFDRFGKGIRTSARDAMLSDESLPETRGKVFGFHRGMDTLGAVIGPLAALIYLNFYPGNYASLFIIAFFPAILGVILTLMLKDKVKAEKQNGEKVKFFSFMKYGKTAPAAYKKTVFGFFAFTIFNSSDVFLLLMIKNSGYGDNDVIMLYIFYNLIYALSSLPMGALADRLGMKKIYILGLLIFCIVYAGLSFKPDKIFLYALFFAYGIYAASTEGVSKAWITKISDKKDTATAIGFYTGLNSLFAIASSSIAGLIWYSFSPEAMFIFSSAGVLCVAVYFLITKENKIIHQDNYI